MRSSSLAACSAPRPQRRSARMLPAVHKGAGRLPRAGAHRQLPQRARPLRRSRALLPPLAGRPRRRHHALQRRPAHGHHWTIGPGGAWNTDGAPWQINPAQADARGNLATLLVRTGGGAPPRPCANWGSWGTESNPENVVALTNLGVALIEQGRAVGGSPSSRGSVAPRAGDAAGNGRRSVGLEERPEGPSAFRLWPSGLRAWPGPERLRQRARA